MYTCHLLNVAVKYFKYVQAFNLKSVIICSLMIGCGNSGGGVGAYDGDYDDWKK